MHKDRIPAVIRVCRDKYTLEESPQSIDIPVEIREVKFRLHTVKSLPQGKNLYLVEYLMSADSKEYIQKYPTKKVHQITSLEQSEG